MDSARDLSPRSAREYVSPRSISSSTNTPRLYSIANINLKRLLMFLLNTQR